MIVLFLRLRKEHAGDLPSDCFELHPARMVCLSVQAQEQGTQFTVPSTTPAKMSHRFGTGGPSSQMPILQLHCARAGLPVLDCDHGNVTEADFRTWAAADTLPETYTVRTGRRVNGKTGEAEFGTQMYYAADDLPTAPWVDGAHGGEVRCASGHVMAAGSVHPDSGELYEVLADAPIGSGPFVCPQPEGIQAASEGRADGENT